MCVCVCVSCDAPTARALIVFPLAVRGAERVSERVSERGERGLLICLIEFSHVARPRRSAGYGLTEATAAVVVGSI